MTSLISTWRRASYPPRATRTVAGDVRLQCKGSGRCAKLLSAGMVCTTCEAAGAYSYGAYRNLARSIVLGLLVHLQLCGSGREVVGWRNLKRRVVRLLTVQMGVVFHLRLQNDFHDRLISPTAD